MTISCRLYRIIPPILLYVCVQPESYAHVAAVEVDLSRCTTAGASVIRVQHVASVIAVRRPTGDYCLSANVRATTHEGLLYAIPDILDPILYDLLEPLSLLE